jgi:chemotaxis protein CheX
MQQIKAEYVNPFLMAARSVVGMACQVEVEIQKPYIRTESYGEDTVTIAIGITGEFIGDTVIAIPLDVALFLASCMMMMPVTVFDEIPRSAISELGNMIMGNAATFFSTQEIGVDITPPTMKQGVYEIPAKAAGICIPLVVNKDKKMEISIYTS